MSDGSRGAEELRCEEKRRKEGGFLSPGLMAFIDDDEDGPMWGHSRSVRPPATSRLGGDGAARWVVCEACTGWLTGGDHGWFK
jgi:hypothetical protein